MKERPILFNASMVRAYLDGRKSQTRRVIKPQPRDVYNNECRKGMQICHECDRLECCDNTVIAMCPQGKAGDRLWVRETHITGYPHDGLTLQCYNSNGNLLMEHVWYKASQEPNGLYRSHIGGDIGAWIGDEGEHCDNIPWKPSIFMPRWASRITLDITGTRVERVQDISEEDAIAEGVEPPRCPKCGYSLLDCRTHMDHRLCGEPDPGSAIPVFTQLWDTINAQRGFGWDTNPLVWVTEFPAYDAAKQQAKHVAQWLADDGDEKAK